MQHLQIVLQILNDHKLFANLKKCSFGQQSLEYLGHIISKERVAADPSKINAMLKWPSPTNLNEIRRFLGLTGYYKRFVKGYNMVANPFILLLKKKHI